MRTVWLVFQPCFVHGSYDEEFGHVAEGHAVFAVEVWRVRLRRLQVGVGQAAGAFAGGGYTEVGWLDFV